MSFFSRISKINIILVFVFFVLIIFSLRVNATTGGVNSTTSCSKNGQPVPWYECLGGTSGTTGSGSDGVDTANFPISFYEKYYTDNGKNDAAFNLTVRRIIFDALFIFASILILGFLAIIVLATIERVNAEDNEEKLKHAKKRINSAIYAIILIIVFMIIGQFISALSGTGALWDIAFFR